MDEEHAKRMRELDTALRNHDWFYHYSDDYSVWRAGEARSKAINEMVSACGRDGQRLRSAYMDITFGPHTGFKYYYPDDDKAVPAEQPKDH